MASAKRNWENVCVGHQGAMEKPYSHLYIHFMCKIQLLLSYVDANANICCSCWQEEADIFLSSLVSCFLVANVS